MSFVALFALIGLFLTGLIPSEPPGSIKQVAELEQRGLKPSPEAERRVLIRRLSFDLICLPPTPEEVAAFVGDKRPDAYEQLVERLLVIA